MASKVILKNETVSAIVLKSLGLSIPASSQIEIESTDYLLLVTTDSRTELEPYFTSGDIVLNDGVRDISATAEREYLDSRTAFGNRFQNDTDRSNGFVSTNTQEAIEETALNSGSSRYAIVFSYNGNASNRWLELFQSVPSDDSPFVVAELGEIASLSISTRTNTTATVSIYINGVAEETITLTSAKVNHKINIAHSLFGGDTLSVKVTSGSTADPIVSVNVKVI